LKIVSEHCNYLNEKDSSYGVPAGPDAPANTDCAVLDLRLPGISGLELQRKLAANGQSIPCIIITAQGDDQAEAEAAAAGAIAFIKKPFKEEVLLAAIDSALKRVGMTNVL
jgi:FixJ family two-component response regulator